MNKIGIFIVAFIIITILTLGIICVTQCSAEDIQRMNETAQYLRSAYGWKIY